MNRDQRRKMEKTLKSRGVTQETISLYLEVLKRADEKPDIAPVIPTGASVVIDAEKIKARKDYGNLSKKYRNFVESSHDRVFHARVERHGLISLLEQPEWLFWSGDLIIVEDENYVATSGYAEVIKEEP